VTYAVLLGSSARRALSERLPESAAFAVYEFLSGPLAANPHRVGAPLRGQYEGQWRAKRGEYRVRYRIDEKDQIVYVLDIEHRRDAYYPGRAEARPLMPSRT